MSGITDKFKPEKLKESVSLVGSAAKDSVSQITVLATDIFSKIGVLAKDTLPTSLTFLSVPELLKWSEAITKAAPTIYDKALDANYLATRIGGGSHRMFDKGHDLVSAWTAVKEASKDDVLKQEVLGYVSAIWKDVTTVKGLPFVTWSKENYEACSEWVSSQIPGATKDWFYDLMSYDVFEVLSTSIGMAGIIFFLSRNDTEKLSEILGAMGIVAITSANPLLGIAVVFCTAYSYFIKKNELDSKQIVVGASLAGISACIFSILGLPLLIELGIAFVSTKLIKDQVFENEELLGLIKSKAANVLPPKIEIPWVIFSRK